MRRDFVVDTESGAIGPVRLGMTRAEIHQQLGQPEAEASRECFFDGFFVEYDSGGRAEFFEVALSEVFRVLFRGLAPLEVSAAEALEHLRRFGEFDSRHRELGCTYFYPDLGLSLWRHFDDECIAFESLSLAAPGYFGQPSD